MTDPKPKSAANALVATQLMLQLLTQAQAVGQTVANAHAAGRDVSDEELDALSAAAGRSIGDLKAATG